MWRGLFEYNTKYGGHEKTGKSKYVKINSLWWDHQEGQKKKNGENIGIPILYIE